LVTRLSGLILFCCLFGLFTPPAEAGQLCLTCHPVHYADKGLCSDCHRGNPSSDRKNIAHQRLIAGRFARFTLGNVAEVEQGKRLLEQFGCRRCHESGGRGNRLATSLDSLMELKPIDEIVLSLRDPARGMPDFSLNDDQIIALVNALFSSSKKNPGRGEERPLAVHFDAGLKERQDVFSRNCGSCHRLLTQKQGLLGSGQVGPNLSGLLSEFYPPSFGNKKRWTHDELRHWLKNPRRIRPITLMRPVLLDKKQLAELDALFSPWFP